MRINFEEINQFIKTKTIEKLGARPIIIDDVPDERVLEELKDKQVDMSVWDITK